MEKDVLFGHIFQVKNCLMDYDQIWREYYAIEGHLWHGFYYLKSDIMQYTSDIIVVPRCVIFTITFFPPPPLKMVVISFLAISICLNCYGLFNECVFSHCFDCCLISKFMYDTQVSSPVTFTVRLRNSLPCLWYRWKKSRLFSVLYIPVVIFETHFAQKLWQPSLIEIHLIEKRAWNLWKFAPKFWNYGAPSFTNFLINTWNKTLQMASWPLCLPWWTFVHLPISEYSTPVSYSSFTHKFLAVSHA
jgi:hypothetical protein